MVRYIVPIVLACLYLAGSAWIVGNEGRAYRESLNRARRETKPPPVPSTVSTATIGRAAGTDAISKPAPPPPNPPPAKLDTVADPAPVARPAEERTPPPPVVAAKPPPPVASPKATAEPDAPTSPVDPAAIISRWKNDPLWSQPQLTRSWDLDRFTAKDEIELGAQLNNLILKLNREDTGSGLRRVKEAARPLLDLVARKDFEYQFVLLNSEVANAFSHPGGYVYVTQKLLDMIPQDEEYLLEFVVGHEIAHVELQHALMCLRAPDVRSFGDGTLQKLYLLIIPHGYPKELEFAADAWVYNRMKRLRRSEYKCMKFLRVLDNYAKANGFENGRGKPADLLKSGPGDQGTARGFSPIDNHLRSHPAAYDRLNHLKELNR